MTKLTITLTVPIDPSTATTKKLAKSSLWAFRIQMPTVAYPTTFKYLINWFEPVSHQLVSTTLRNSCLPHKPQLHAEPNQRAEGIERQDIRNTTKVPLCPNLAPRPAQIGWPKGEHLLPLPPANQSRRLWKLMKLQLTIYPNTKPPNFGQHHQDSKYLKAKTLALVEGEIMPSLA